ncbi:MAG: cell division protein ZapA, partial [Clostridia bacterium]
MFENNQKRRVSLNIAGTELTIITTSSEIELKKLEENLSSSVEKILDAKPNASMLDAVLLVALSNEQKLYTEDKT